MASKKYTGKIDLLLDIKPSDLESMTRKDLAQVVTRLRDAGQKRLKRLEGAGTYSPAAEYIKRTGGLRQIRGLNVAELRNEYMRLKGFIGSKTGTVKGARSYQKAQENIIKELAEKAISAQTGTAAEIEVSDLERKMPDGTLLSVWNLIDRATESKLFSRLRYQKYMGIAVQTIQDTKTTDKDQVFNEFINRIEKEYDKLSKNDKSLVNPSDIFQ